MGEINIKYDLAKEKIKKISDEINNDLMQDIVNRYNSILSYFEKSQGDFADTLRTHINEEKELVNSISTTLMKLHNYLEESLQDFKDSDEKIKNLIDKAGDK